MRQRARDGDALLLPARELCRQSVVHALEGHELQQFLAARAALGRLDLAHTQRELDVLADGHVAEQRVMLEHEADFALAHIDVRDVAAVQRHAAVVDLGQAGDRPQQRALAAAARAEQDQELALGDAQRDVVDDGDALVPLGYLVECDGHAQVTELPGIFPAS